MKALTICQSYAHLIVTPQAKLPKGHWQKRVENRTWWTKHRGLLLIHAGKGQQWLPTYPGVEQLGRLEFGAIIGVAWMCDCIKLERHADGGLRAALGYKRLYPWLENHPHASGPRGFIFSDAQPFHTPIRYSGAQGLFDVPEHVVAAELARLGIDPAKLAEEQAR